MYIICLFETCILGMLDIKILVKTDELIIIFMSCWNEKKNTKK